MSSLSITRDGWGSIVRLALLVAAVSTYLLSPDDVVWHFIKTAPYARSLEHVAFGTAAALLGVALFLKARTSFSAQGHRAPELSRSRYVTTNSLQALGIGSLLPLPGFLLLVLGDLATSLFLDEGHPISKELRNGVDVGSITQRHSWSGALVDHIGLFCAFVSMLIFSITLVDRIADALFGTTALISVAASSRHALRARASHS